MSTGQLIGSIALWTGVFGAILKLTDWLLSSKQKVVLATWSESAFVWLDDQRLGKFIKLVRSVRAQRILSLIAHLLMIVIVLSFFGRIYLGWNIDANVQIGHPRIYRFQVWVDVLALMISALLLTWKVHPRVTAWIAAAPSMPRYFARVTIAMIAGYVAMGAYAFGTIAPFPDVEPFAPGYDSRVEAAYSGRIGVIAVHAVTALIGAPLLAETWLLVTVWFFSLYWFVFIWALTALHAAARLLALRITDHKDGPVIGVSLLLVAIGAAAKAVAP